MTGEITRQGFLRVALGVAGTSLLSSCLASTAPAPASTSTASAPPDWGALDAAIDGHVVLPSNAGYPAAKTVFNMRYSGSAPAAVVTADSVGDVRKAVTFAATHGIELTARSGGHSYVGASSADGALVLDLRQLPGQIYYDAASGLATVPAATALSVVQQTLNGYGRSIPTGSCPSVGVAGLTMGGGLGADARRYGLTCDALVSAAVVLPSGEPVTAAADDHADLYWALRGGAGCGVATSFTFQTFPTTDRDVVTLVFPEDAAGRVIHGWHDWLGAADRTIWGMVNMTVGPGSGRCSVVLAAPAGAGPALADDLIAAIGATPTDNTSRTLDHMAFVAYFSGGSDAVRPRAFVAGSDVVAQLTADAAQAVVAAASAWPRELGAATAVVESLDGAVGDVAADATAFPWRRHAACVQWYVETPTPALVDAADQWLATAHDAMRASSTGGYLNYLEPSTPAARYLGVNLPRLVTVRQRYDPAAVMYSSLRW